MTPHSASTAAPLSDEKNEPGSNAAALRSLSSKVLFALSQTHFGAVFGRITSRLQEVSTCNDEAPDYSDIDLIQHVDLNVHRLMKLLSGEWGVDLCVDDVRFHTMNVYVRIELQRSSRSSG